MLLLGCDTHFEPVGCFADKQNLPRPLPDYIQNERDYRHTNWNGKLIEWNNWNNYTPGLICRCAEKAKKLGHTTFSIQFYGNLNVLSNEVIDLCMYAESAFSMPKECFRFFAQ